MHDGKIWIKDWKGDRREMSPEDFLERVRKDSKSNWNWLAPASEIVKTISDPDFPEEYANELKTIILTCFAKLLLDERRGTSKEFDDLAVAYCYYSVHGKKGKATKRLYRKNLIESIYKFNHWRFWPESGHGEQWKTWVHNWKKDALAHFTQKFGIDFFRWENRILDQISKDAKLATESGAFEEDRESYERGMEKIAAIITGATPIP